MLIYHGTTLENFKNILIEDFNPTNKVWNCSSNDCTYFYNPSKFIELQEASNYTEAKDIAIKRAFENAQITASIQNSKEDKIVVIEYETLEENIYEDDSCDNMELACYIIDARKENIKCYYISNYYIDLRLFYLLGLRNNDFINLDLLSYTSRKALNIIPRGVFVEELLEIDYKKVEINELVYV